jgi:hypothetical protein
MEVRAQHYHKLAAAKEKLELQEGEGSAVAALKEQVLVQLWHHMQQLCRLTAGHGEDLRLHLHMSAIQRDDW